MRRLLVAVGALSAAAIGAVAYWRRHPTTGSRFMNEVVDPFLVERGIAGVGRSEVGTIEHIGRRTGIRRLTPVHPVPTEDGFLVVVPLGGLSQWARNVLAAGHCRLQLHDTVHELDEPALVEPSEIEHLSAPARWACARLGFRYLRLHRFAEAPGVLEPVVPGPDTAEPEVAGAEVADRPEEAAATQPSEAGVEAPEPVASTT